jgi:uncharacterized membrane protein YagU involved in acid resistance
MATPAPTSISWNRIFVQALVAGIVGGALLDLYLCFTPLASAHPGILGMWTWIASTVAGKTMFANPNAPWIGLGVHALTSIVWAGAYAYVAAQQGFVRRRWYISGPVYGLVVSLVMQLVLLVSGNFEYPHSPNDFVSGLVAHAAFFGLPVAFVVNALSRRG